MKRKKEREKQRRQWQVGTARAQDMGKTETEGREEQWGKGGEAGGTKGGPKKETEGRRNWRGAASGQGKEGLAGVERRRKQEE